MSKQVDWTSSTITCECDNCGETIELKFVGEPNLKKCQQEIEKMGWRSRKYYSKYENSWDDFCCEECEKKCLGGN